MSEYYTAGGGWPAGSRQEAMARYLNTADEFTEQRKAINAALDRGRGWCENAELTQAIEAMIDAKVDRKFRGQHERTAAIRL